MLKTSLTFIIAGAVLACAQTANITVQNPGFETATLPLLTNLGQPWANLSLGLGTLPGWITASNPDGSVVGVINPGAGGGKWWDGNNEAFLTVAGPGTALLSQILTASLQNNTTYNLSAIVAGQPPAFAFNYAVQLWAGNTVLASSSKFQGMQAFYSGVESAVYYSGSNNPHAGQPLTIVLSSGAAAGQTTNVGFDDISLTATPGQVITNVLPQFVYGGGWATTLYFTNTGPNPVSFPINFIDGNGKPLSTPVGTSTTVNIPAFGAASIQFPNSGQLVQGYVSLTLASGVTGYGVFRQSVSGEPDQEAVVPLSAATSITDTLLFDDTNGIVTGVAIVNLGNATAVNAAAHDANGNVLGSASIPLAPNGKTAVTLQSIIPATAGVTGSVQFTVTTGNVAALGLRFSGAAFTSIPTSDK